MERLEIAGLTAHASPRVVDFRALGPGLIAVVGPNGSGKTTLLEASGVLTLFRRSAYYETPIIDAVRAGCTDAYTDLTWSQDGVRYRVRVSCDAVKRKTEALLWVGDVAGAPVAGPTLAEVDDRLAAVLPPAPLFLASVFAAQRNATSFFELPPAKRKDLFIAMLGLDHLQATSEAAGAQARRTELERASLRGRVEQAQVAAARLTQLRYDAGVCRERATNLAAEVAPWEETVASLQEKQAAVKARVATAQADYDAAVLARREVVERQAQLAAERTRLNRVIEAADAKLTDWDAAMAADKQLASARRSADHLLDDLAAKRDAIGKLQTQLATHSADVRRIRERLQATRDAKAQDERLVAAAGSVNLDLDLCQRCELTASAVAAKARVKELTEREATQLASGRRARVVEREAQEQLAMLEAGLGDLPARAQAARAELQKLEGLASKAASLIATKTERDVAATRLVEVSNTLMDLVVPPEPTCVDGAVLARVTESLASAQSCLALARRQVSEAEAELERTLGQIEAIEHQAQGLAEDEARASVLETREVDWALLAKAFGRDGIQALEIDAAGPAVQTIANDLLASCYGTRFTLKLVTTRPTKGGGVKEIFDAQILDSEADRTVNRGSGGEQVILDEALRLALAIFNARKSGCELRTLWRDESVGPLDEENSGRYVAMLRAAMTLGNFHQCILIAHNEAVWGAADVQVKL